MYEKLIEKKMELLEGLKQEHEIRLEILKMEKETKLMELENAKASNRRLNKNNLIQLPEAIDFLVGESIEFS